MAGILDIIKRCGVLKVLINNCLIKLERVEHFRLDRQTVDARFGRGIDKEVGSILVNALDLIDGKSWIRCKIYTIVHKSLNGEIW